MSLQQAYRGGYEGRPGWWLHFGYDEEIVEKLKAFKHGEERAWDEEKKRWWISEGIAPQVLVFLPALEAHLRQGALFDA